MAIHCCCCVLRPACYCYGCVNDDVRQNLYRKIILNCAVGNSFSEARRDVRMVLITRTVRSLRHQRPERCVGRRWVLRLVLCNNTSRSRAASSPSLISSYLGLHHLLWDGAHSRGFPQLSQECTPVRMGSPAECACVYFCMPSTLL